MVNEKIMKKQRTEEILSNRTRTQFGPQCAVGYEKLIEFQIAGIHRQTLIHMYNKFR